jgi:hypothetical protein
MMDISPWQDVVKENHITMMSTWHFCDTPVVAPGFTPKSVPDTYNVSSILFDCTNTLLDPATTSVWSISFCLRSIIHFVGDAHQPLHASELFSTKYPKGDLGGNSITLHCSFGSPCRNLHMMWDSALLMYQFNDYSRVRQQFEANVTHIVTDFPAKRQSPNFDTIDPFVMARDPYNVSVHGAYGLLDSDLSMTDNYFLPNRASANGLLSLAGFRLGRILQKFFTRKGVMGLLNGDEATMSIREAFAWAVDGMLAVIVAAFVVMQTFGRLQEPSIERSLVKPLMA